MPGVVIIDPNQPEFGFSVGNDQAAGVHADIENDALYLTDLTNIVQWEGDSANKQTYTWRSGRIRLAQKVNLGAGMVEADSYDSITFKLYAILNNNAITLMESVTVTSHEPFRLPGGYTSNLYEIEIISTDRVTGVSVGQNLFDLAGG
jgi:hypothetical protein